MPVDQETIRKNEKTSQTRKKYLQNTTPSKGPKICKEFLKLSNKITKCPIQRQINTKQKQKCTKYMRVGGDLVRIGSGIVWE